MRDNKSIKPPSAECLKMSSGFLVGRDPKGCVGISKRLWGGPHVKNFNYRANFVKLPPKILLRRHVAMAAARLLK